MTVKQLTQEFKEALSGKNVSGARHLHSELCTHDLSVVQLQKIVSLLEEHKDFLSTSDMFETSAVAVLGGYTTQPIELAVRNYLFAEGVLVDLYASEYNTYEMEVLNPNSGLYRHSPDLILIATGNTNIRRFPATGMSTDDCNQLASEEVSSLERLWTTIRKHTDARIVQHDFDLPHALPLGRLERKYSWSKTSFVESVNRLLWERAPAGVHILPLYDLAMHAGSRQWFEPRWYYHSKHGFSPGHVSEYGQEFAALYRAIRGRSKKCLVLDLDNTLWGGVIGDDGLEGIALGEHSAEGEAYREFCKYVLSLKERGVLLAVNSKNEESIAREVFDAHPEMPLAVDDFSVFCCNWNDKGSNLKFIAQELNIGLDTLVMLDDSSFECSQIRQSVPEVRVIQMQGDPASFISLIDRARLFEQASLTQEDFSRSATLATTRNVRSLQETGGDALTEFLEGLEMQASFTSALDVDLPRVEQLFQKTNQFNFTTYRYTAREIQAFMEEEGKFCFVCVLKDTYSHYGIISSLLGQVESEELVIENWVMSCRVFSRSLEQYIFNELRGLAEENGCSAIRINYIPTKKNMILSEIIPKLGLVSESAVPSEEGKFLHALEKNEQLPTSITRLSDAAK